MNNNNSPNLKYSKLNMIKNNNNLHKSRSLDFSDLSNLFSQTQKSIRKCSLFNKPRSTSSTSKTQIDANISTIDDQVKKSSKSTKDDQSIGDSCPMKKDEYVGSKSGASAALRRNGSVSMSSMKSSILSMRRCSSVNAERYCRIYDQSIEDQELMQHYHHFTPTSQHKNQINNKGAKILKRFFGF